MITRKFDRDRDFDGVRACLIELQNFERRIDPRRPSGAEIADVYIEDALSRCAEHRGRILVADCDGKIAGLVTILASVRSGALDDGDIEYAYIADLVVRDMYRGRGIGRQLMAEAEKYARQEGANWLRISVLAENAVARRLYKASGFSELCLDLEKPISADAGQGVP